MEIIGLTLFGIVILYFVFLIVKGLVNEKNHTEKILTTHTVKLEEVVQPKEELFGDSIKTQIDIIEDTFTESVEITEKPAPKKRSKKVSKKVE